MSIQPCLQFPYRNQSQIFKSLCHYPSPNRPLPQQNMKVICLPSKVVYFAALIRCQVTKLINIGTGGSAIKWSQYSEL